MSFFHLACCTIIGDAGDCLSKQTKGNCFKITGVPGQVNGKSRILSKYITLKKKKRKGNEKILKLFN